MSEPITNEPIWESDEPIHEFFELSYANYLTLPRCALQTMPFEWQRRFVALLEEMRATIDEDFEPEGGYQVNALDGDSRVTDDPYADYERGRRRLRVRDAI